MNGVVVILGVGGAVAVVAGMRALVRTRVRERLAATRPGDAGDVRGPAPTTRTEAATGLRGWLQRAGFRSSRADAAFLGVLAAAALLSILGFAAFDRLALLARAREWAVDAPGVLAALGVPLVAAAPWVVTVLLLAAPFLVVRARRAARVERIEEDLPAVLELLAAMARAGLGFAAGTARLIESESSERPLIHELGLLQRDGTAGVARAEALRRMAARVDVPALSTFCSALIHAESAGIGLADLLRRQAEDLRSRRREQALLRAQSLPVKLVFPLVLCFLPGLFVFTLGPAFATFFQLADSIAQGQR
ncbi:MAG: type II secretion system F family protein [Planctomycetota bacterium JB042]